MFYNRSGANAAYLSGNNPSYVPPTTKISRRSWIGNPQHQEAQRQSSGMAESEGYAGPATGVGPSPSSSQEMVWDSVPVKASTTRLSRSSASDSKDGSTSLSDVYLSGTSTSVSDLSYHQVSPAQATQNTNPEQPGPTRSFACPFFKHNPNKYGETCSNGWKHIHRLKHVLAIPEAAIQQGTNHLLQGALVSEAPSSKAHVYPLPDLFRRRHLARSTYPLRDTMCIEGVF